MGRRLRARGKAHDAEKRCCSQFFLKSRYEEKGETTITVEVVMTIMGVKRDPYDLKENKRRLHSLGVGHVDWNLACCDFAKELGEGLEVSR